MRLNASALVLLLLPSCNETGITAAGETQRPPATAGPPILELTPQTTTLPELPRTCEITGEITARSIGESPVTITEINLDPPFTLGSIQLPLTILPNEEAPIPFSWVADVDVAATLEVISDSIDGPEYAGILGDVRPLAQVTEFFQAPLLPQAEVYIAGSHDVYEWDPVTHESRHIGRSPQLLLDLAIDYDGILLGSTSSSQLLRIDPETGAVSTFLSISISGANALTVLPDNRIIAASGSRIYEIDRTTGNATIVMTSALGSSSGDIVAVGDLLYWSISGGDRIVRIDPATWTETLVGDTGRPGLWGLASPSEELWAFSSGGFAYRINTATAQVLEEVRTGISAYGATHNPFFVAGELETAYTLREPALPESLHVLVDRAPTTAWTYDPATQLLTFEPDALLGGEVIEVTYEVQPSCGN